MMAQRRAYRDNFLYHIECHVFLMVFDVWQGCPQRYGVHRKRELLNKFAKCIGARLRHLILSGLIFCSIKQSDENYFHIVLFSDIQHGSQTGEAGEESTQDGHTSGQ
jgi:hypothetical protein